MKIFSGVNVNINNNILRKDFDESILKNKDKMINYTDSLQNNYTGKIFI